MRIIPVKIYGKFGQPDQAKYLYVPMAAVDTDMQSPVGHSILFEEYEQPHLLITDLNYRKQTKRVVRKRA